MIAVSDNNFEISTANGLKAFAKLATEAKDPGYPNQKTINAKVTADLDATGMEWKNVVLEPKSRVSVHIDGNDKSISNINVTDEGNVALFASAGSDKNSGATMTIKDFTVKDSAFVSTKYVNADGTAVFIGHLTGECSMTNCTVKDCALTTQKYAGGFVGYDAHGSSTPVFTNCTVDGLTLTSTATSGSTSMGGFFGYSQTGYTINGLDVKNVTNNGANGATVYYGLYFGTPNATMTLTDCHQSTGLAGRMDGNVVIN